MTVNATGYTFRNKTQIRDEEGVLRTAYTVFRDGVLIGTIFGRGGAWRSTQARASEVVFPEVLEGKAKTREKAADRLPDWTAFPSYVVVYDRGLYEIREWMGFDVWGDSCFSRDAVEVIGEARMTPFEAFRLALEKYGAGAVCNGSGDIVPADLYWVEHSQTYGPPCESWDKARGPFCRR